MKRSGHAAPFFDCILSFVELLTAEAASLLVGTIVIAAQTIRLDLGQNGVVQRVFLIMTRLIAVTGLVGGAVALLLGALRFAGGSVTVQLALMHRIRTGVGAQSGAQHGIG